MRAFKGFNKDLTCRGYQYEEGKKFHTERAECCDTGFHACEYPLDCFGYYDPAHSVFHEVELSGEMDKSNDNTKVCATDLLVILLVWRLHGGMRQELRAVRELILSSLIGNM